MATKNTHGAQVVQTSLPTTPVLPVAGTVAPVPTGSSQLTIEIPTSITLKDVIVIATALITIVSSWTFYTMRLSVLEQKIIEVKAQIDKSATDIDQVKKDMQDMRLRQQAVEIRLQYKK